MYPGVEGYTSCEWQGVVRSCNRLKGTPYWEGIYAPNWRANRIFSVNFLRGDAMGSISLQAGLALLSGRPAPDVEDARG